MSILTELQNTYPDCWFKAGHEFDGGSAAVWSGEGSTMPDGFEAFNSNAWESDPKEQTYTMDVHNELRDFVESRGYFWESYDCGTFLLYKV